MERWIIRFSFNPEQVLGGATKTDSCRHVGIMPCADPSRMRGHGWILSFPTTFVGQILSVGHQRVNDHIPETRNIQILPNLDISWQTAYVV